MLDSKRLSDLYNIFRDTHTWKSWHTDYIAEVTYFRGLSAKDFVSAENQERLWRARGVSSIGPGESVNVKSAYSDQQISDLFLQVRDSKWPNDVFVRAKSITDIYNKILAAVYQNHSDLRPHAKLGRAFATLLPHDLHTCFTPNSKRNIDRLTLGNKGYSFCEGAVITRDQIRKAVARDVSVEEAIWQSMFCWWLNESYEEIINKNSLEEFFTKSPAEEQDSQVLLEIWPPSKQRKGLTAITKYLEAFRMVVTATRGGATPEDVVMTIKTDPGFARYAPSSCRQLFNLVRTFGFIKYNDGLWYPSDDGEELVEIDPPNVLVEKLLVEVFGFGHTIIFIDKHGKVTRRQLFDYLKSTYTAWTSDFMPSALFAWLKSVGMIDSDNTLVTLTEYGKYWVNRLPAELPVPGAAVELDKDISAQQEEKTFVGLSVKQISDGFANDADMNPFVFSQGQIEALHFAWHCNSKKRFVILSGLSGTGKTAMLVLYANLYCKLLDLSADRHVSVIPVSPDWRDPSGIFGYFNALHADPTYQAEPGLRLIIDAVQNPDLPFFLILDEMNLARVERYFAPFLSSMETGHRLLLHAHDETVNDVPPSVPWPRNLFIGGTVNMDETTHAFSDKVLDRAFTMEFWQVDLPEFFKRRQDSNGFSMPAIEGLMVRVNDALFKIRRHFGYRTAGEVLDFIGAAGPLNNDDDLWRLADQAFFSKVLPRIRGEQTQTLELVLKDLGDIFASKSMGLCKAKLESMRESLSGSGVARFWS